jgi:hypothetical protein
MVCGFSLVCSADSSRSSFITTLKSGVRWKATGNMLMTMFATEVPLSLEVLLLKPVGSWSAA